MKQWHSSAYHRWRSMQAYITIGLIGAIPLAALIFTWCN